MSDQPAPPAESIDDPAPSKPGLMARLLGRIRPGKQTESESDASPVVGDASAAKSSLLSRLFRRKPAAEAAVSASEGSQADSPPIQPASTPSADISDEAAQPAGGVMALIRSHLILILILAGVVLVGVLIILIVLVVVKRHQAAAPKPVAAVSAPAKPTPTAPEKAQVGHQQGGHEVAAHPSEHGSSVASDTSHGKADDGDAHPSPAGGEPKVEAVATDHGTKPATEPSEDPLAEARRQLELERAKLEEEKKALADERKALQAQRSGKGNPAGAVSKPSLIGDCSLTGGDTATRREALRRCLGLPDKPVEAESAKPVEPADDKHDEKKAKPKSAQDAHY